MRPARADAVSPPQPVQVVRHVGLQQGHRVAELPEAVEEVDVGPVAVAVCLGDLGPGLQGGGGDAHLDGLQRAERRAHDPEVAASGSLRPVRQRVRLGEEGMAVFQAVRREQPDLVPSVQGLHLVFEPADRGGRGDDLRRDRVALRGGRCTGR